MKISSPSPMPTKLFLPVLLLGSFLPSPAAFADQAAGPAGFVPGLVGSITYPETGNVDDSLAMEGAVAVCGQPEWENRTGRVGIYHKEPGQDSWKFHQHLLVPADASARFGSSVALQGSTLWVASNPYLLGQAKVHEFELNAQNDRWEATGRSLPSDANARVFQRLAFDGKHLFAAFAEEDAAGTLSDGYVRVYDSATLALQATLRHARPEGTYSYGARMGVGDDFVAIGAPGVGEVEIWRFASGAWSRGPSLLAPPNELDSDFGWIVAAHGDRLHVSAGWPARVFHYRKSAADVLLLEGVLSQPLEPRLFPPYVAAHGSFLVSSGIDYLNPGVMCYRNLGGSSYECVGMAPIPIETVFNGRGYASVLSDRFLASLGDSVGGDGILMFHLLDPAGNMPPVFVTKPPAYAELGAGFRYEVRVQDDAGAAGVSMSSAADLPPWLNFEDRGGGVAVLSGSRPVSAGGVVKVKLRARDVAGAASEHFFSLPVVPKPAVELVGNVSSNPWTGLTTQLVKVTNLSGHAISGFAVWLRCARQAHLYNGMLAPADPALAGATHLLQYGNPLAAGASITLSLVLFDPYHQPSFTVLGATLEESSVTFSGGFQVSSILPTTNGTLVEFPTEPGATYEIYWAPDPAGRWTPSPLKINAGGTRTQWIDRGPPFTTSPTSGAESRFYKVRKL
jgi:hypothetical protein